MPISTLLYIRLGSNLVCTSAMRTQFVEKNRKFRKPAPLRLHSLHVIRLRPPRLRPRRLRQRKLRPQRTTRFITRKHVVVRAIACVILLFSRPVVFFQVVGRQMGYALFHNTQAYIFRTVSSTIIILVLVCLFSKEEAIDNVGRT